jgi:hypothetical protein
MIFHRDIIPILDGLDEVAVEARAQCLVEVNLFWSESEGAPMILCSRAEEYEALPERLPFGGAVRVVSLTDREIDRYLAAAGPRWRPVRAALAIDDGRSLSKLLSSPLMLNVAVLAYREGDPAALIPQRGEPPNPTGLWAQYVTEMQRRYPKGMARSGQETHSYAPERVTEWLGWLASVMRDSNETELWLHELVGPPWFQTMVRIGLGFASWSIFAFAFGAHFGEVPGLVVGLLLGAAIMLAVGPEPAFRREYSSPRDRLRSGFRMGRMVGLALGLIVGLSTGLADRGEDVLARVRDGVIASLVVGCLSAMIVGLVFALLKLGYGPEIRRVVPRSPTQLIGDSARRGLALGSICALIASVPIGLSVGGARGGGAGIGTALEIGLVVGLPLTLIFGLDCLAFHYLARLWLSTTNRAPLRYLQFLQWATAHLLLRSGGYSYEWPHVELREYLASQYQATHAAASRAPLARV